MRSAREERKEKQLKAASAFHCRSSFNNKAFESFEEQTSKEKKVGRFIVGEMVSYKT